MVCFASGLEMIVGPEKFVVKLGGGTVVTRRQLPLRLAWAISVHKSQVNTAPCSPHHAGALKCAFAIHNYTNFRSGSMAWSLFFSGNDIGLC